METPTLVLLILSILAGIWVCLPNVLVVLEMAPLKHRFEGGPEELTETNPRLDQDLRIQLENLDFQPLGLYRETVPGSRPFHEFVFTNPKEHAYALLYPMDQGLPNRVGFLTVFDDGAVAFTKNYAGGVDFRTQDFLVEGGAQIYDPAPHDDLPVSEIRVRLPINAMLALIAGPVIGVGAVIMDSMKFATLGLATIGYGVSAFLFRARVKHPGAIEGSPNFDERAPTADVLRRHRVNVAWLRDRGHPLTTSHDLGSFLLAEQRYYAHPVLQFGFQEAMRMLLAPKLVPMMLILPAGYWLGFTHPAPWAVLLGVNLVQAGLQRL